MLNKKLINTMHISHMTSIIYTMSKLEKMKNGITNLSNNQISETYKNVIDKARQQKFIYFTGLTLIYTLFPFIFEMLFFIFPKKSSHPIAKIVFTTIYSIGILIAFAITKEVSFIFLLLFMINCALQNNLNIILIIMILFAFMLVLNSFYFDYVSIYLVWGIISFLILLMMSAIIKILIYPIEIKHNQNE